MAGEFAHIAHTKKGKRQKKMLEALEGALGIVTIASKHSGIPRRTHYQWMEDDSEYRKAVLSIGDITLDAAESKLIEKIKAGDTASIIFYLKTKGKKRGFIEKLTIDEINVPTLQVQFTSDADNPLNSYEIEESDE